MMTLVLAFMGVAQAEVVTIGSGTESSPYLPGHAWYRYASSQQLYTPAEIGSAGTINSIAFYNVGESRTRTIDLYLVNTSKTAFTSSIDWIQPTTADQVFTGTITFTPDTWTTITLATPFDYDGTSNLAVIYVDNTGSYVPGPPHMECRVYVGAENSAMWKYQDSPYDPFNTVAGAMNIGTYLGMKNQIQLDITRTGGGGATYDDKLHVKYEDPVNGEIIDSLNLGVRPIGAWMAPFEFTMFSEGPVYQINLLDFTPTDGLFTVDGEELPFMVAPSEDVQLNMSTNGTTAGVVERQFVAIAEVIREAHIWPVVVEFYSPEVPDVVELPCEDVPANIPYSMPFVEWPATDHGTTLHNDYTLPFPEIPEGYDAVYKLNYDKDFMLNAEVTSGADGKVALYAAGFNGEGGPMADNYYTGPIGGMGGGSSAAPFDVQIGDGTSISGYYPMYAFYKYSISEQLFLAPELQAAGVTTAPFTSLSWYAETVCSQQQNNISIWMANVSDNAVSTTSHITSGMTLVYTGSLNAVEGWNEFVFNGSSFSWDGSSNILICVQRNNGAYQSGLTWQNTTTSFNATGYVYNDSNGAYDMTTTSYPYSGYYGGVTTSRANIKMKSNGGGSSKGLRTSTMSYGPVITDAAVAAGTYYLVASSTDADFEVTIDAAEMPCPDVDHFAFNPSPADDADSIVPANVTLQWSIPEYATEWRIIVGSTYHPELNHPQTIYYPKNDNNEWVWSREMVNSFTITDELWNNTNYFWRVEFRNNSGCIDGVSSPVWGFTTTLNVPTNLTVEDETVFDDEVIKLSWDQVVDRTYRFYYVYRNYAEPSNSPAVFERIAQTEVNHIDSTNYVDGPLDYNMEGYVYYVTAVYDEGESLPSNTVTVKVSGYGQVAGHVYEQDGTIGIAGATVTVDGVDEFGDPHTYNFTTDANGYYEGTTYAGEYDAVATCPGYQPVSEPECGNPITITYDHTTQPVDFIMDENFYGPCGVVAEYYPDATDINSEYVKVYWGCGLPIDPIVETFESGNFGAFPWVNDATYPWTIDGTNAHEGSYCMKSGGAGVAYAESTIKVEIDIPEDGLMSFDSKISSENNWDYGYFYIDNSRKGSFSGAGSWENHEYAVTAGTHTFRWVYKKDVSGNQGDDCFYVDNITFFRQLGSDDATRALNHYRVYRTNCYNNGPYEEPTTVLLATVWVPDTVYIDVEWADLDPGVYKWGVGAVYEGNRGEEIESPITWTAPIAVNNNNNVEANRDVVLFEGFEGGMAGWEMVDCDAGSGVSNVHSYEGDYAFRFHWTYDEPDYLVSPMLPTYSGQLGVSFWYNSFSTYWEETFEVGYSTTSNDPSAFTFGTEIMADGSGWEEFTATFPEGTKYIAIKYTAYNQFYLYIDNITLTATAGGGSGSSSGSLDNPYAAGTEPIQLERESVIAWSNCLDKDMYLYDGLVSVNVLLNSADPSYGVTVDMTNLNEIEQGLYPVDQVVLDSSAYYAWESFRRGEYAVHIEMEGYYPIDDTVSIWEPTELRYVMTEILNGIAGIYVSRTGWASWDGLIEPTPGPGPEPGPGGETITDSFEDYNAFDVDPTGGFWTFYDGDGGATYGITGVTFENVNYVGAAIVFNPGQIGAASNYPAHTGNQFIAMFNAIPAEIVSGTTTNDWMISGELTNATTLSFFARELTTSYGAETMRVLYSTTTNDPSAFQLIQQVSVNVAEWTEYTFSLPTGTKYVAINCVSDDVFALFIDDVTIGTPSTRNNRHLESYKVMCTSLDGVQIFNHDTPADQPFCQLTTIDPNTGIVTLEEGEHYLVKVACVYSSGMSEWSDPVEWVYEPCEHWGPVDEVTAETQAEGNHIQWVFDHSYNPYSLDLDRAGDNTTHNAGGDLSQYKNAPVYRQYAEDGVLLNFFGIDNVYFRSYLLYNLSRDNRFSLVPENEYGHYILTPAYEMRNFMEVFEEFYQNAETDFSLLGKMEVTEQSSVWKSGVAPTDYLSIMMDIMTATSRADNDHCINSMPFCTTEILQFPAAHEGGATADENAEFGCVSSQPYPSWYHMRIREAGPFVIHMEAHDPDNPTANRDIDYCIWGPFDDPYAPCLNDLTCDKIIDCSYSTASVEDVYLGYPVSQHTSHHGTSLADGTCITNHVPQVGEYYILMITNYSQQQCDISFTKTEGEGETDCELVAPSDALGFLITMDGEFLTFIMNPNIREYTHVGEFGEHEYCVRPIYPGLQELPEHNYYFSMGCPVASNWDVVPVTCDPGDAIHAEAMGATDQVKIWWGEETPGPGPGGETITDDFEGYSAFAVDPANDFWTFYDGDGGSTYSINGASFTNQNYEGAAIVFNPAQAGLATNYPAHSGDQFIAMFNAVPSTILSGSTTNDWMISGELTNPTSFSFFARELTDQYGAETMRVLYSTTTNDPSAFQLIQQVSVSVTEWTEYSYELPAGTKYVAINCVSDDVFALFIDDVTISAGRNRDASIVSYNVYRSEQPTEGYAIIGNVPAVEGQTYYEYIDTPEAVGMYFYQVTAVYDNGCESDPAQSFDNPVQNYVQAEVTGLGENNDKVALYPNPTKGNVTIEANGMSRITVVSVLGQVVFDTEVDADSYILNMAQFNAGMYMVRVYTEDGVTVKRVTVM